MKQTKRRPRTSKSGPKKPVREAKSEIKQKPTPAFYESVVSGSPIGITVVDNHCHIRSINSAALEVFDLNREKVTPPDESTQSPCFLDLLPESEQPRWQYMINMVLSTRDSFANNRYFHNTGYVEKVLSVHIAPLPPDDLATDGLIIAVEDVTDNVLMEKYLILSEKLVAKGEMATSIAHELNEQLDRAANNARMLASNLKRERPEQTRENCEAITEAIGQIRRFVDNLIDFSKPHTEYINYDIKHLIEDLLFSLRIQPRFKQTHFTINLSRDIPNLEIDVGQIQQVLMNILNNAADAIEEKAIEFQGEGCELKREIEIEASYDKESETVMIDVTDNGVGMTDETEGKIFDKHFSTKKSGHGLGLYNCRKIIEQHHGELMAQSEYGEGATFRIFLPRSQPKQAQ